MADAAPSRVVITRHPIKQYVPLRTARQGSAPGLRPRMLTNLKREHGADPSCAVARWSKPIKPFPPPQQPELSRPRTANGSGSKKLQHALVCARLLAENKAYELAAQRAEAFASGYPTSNAVLPPDKIQPRGRCKSASSVKRAVRPLKEPMQPQPPSSNLNNSSNNNQRQHHLPRCKFQAVEHEVISIAAITNALAAIVTKPANRPERDEICFGMMNDGNGQSTTLDGYVLGKVVGVGTFGKVRVATHKVSSQVVAIKSYERSRTKDAGQWKRIQYEAKLMEKLDHPYIIRLFETIETPTKLHIVMENVSSDVGNLCEFVKRQKRLAEDDAGLLFMQVLSAVMYMHSMQLVHRDIKLENILLDRYGNTKLVDFGFSAVQTTSKPFSTFCGTPCYMAPEIIHRKTYWGQPVDVWSLGVLLFAMLCGYFPFRARNYNDLYRKIVKGGFDIPGFVTPDAHALLRGMLEGDPSKRLQLHDVRNHAWTRKFHTARHQHLPLYRQLSLDLLADTVRSVLQHQLLDHIEHLGLPRSMVTTALTEKRYNGLSTLYYLLLARAESMCRDAAFPASTPTVHVSSSAPSPIAATSSLTACTPPSATSEAPPARVQPEASVTLDSLAQLSGSPPLPPPEDDFDTDPWLSRELQDVVEILHRGI
ncbi:CAMK/CAMKL protein kinase [Aphanomyces invadans]|uniref:CAMK/CAMKL protein kinase n=1 Tax=Aphanomyces invadans TaxID=157072 RepID=A0A024URK5_9STRA|nr:CAMK/CAMKL protein kinase [Aphanomyces invadans]ETW09081.1 CAMK/CAMKL protein kinase [Aphanomyces invadans]|eukprot:XP_008862886.1 CAMK/CAMKL protein kinase [Aphanomyces invadans]